MTPEHQQLLIDLTEEWNRTGQLDLALFLRQRLPHLALDGPLGDEVASLLNAAVEFDRQRRSAGEGHQASESLSDYLRQFPELARLSMLAAVQDEQVPSSHPSLTVVSTTAPVPPALHQTDPLPGSMIGAYQIVREIGRGGMGTVYEAIHPHLGKRVALKVLSNSVVSERSLSERFRREMRAAGRVDHPNIIRALDAGEVNGTLYLVMELASGTDLRQWITRAGPRPLVEALGITREAALALAAAHAQGVVHRDVKPANLLLTEHGAIKLLDLGLARLADDSTGDLTHTGSLFGTPDYMAPEQWDDARQVDGRADLYSLGCTLFYLITGQAPYSGQQHATPASKMKAHLSAALPELPASIPDPTGAVQHLIHQLMAKDPRERYHTGAEVAATIEGILRQLHPVPDNTRETAVTQVWTPSGLSHPQRRWPPVFLQTLLIALTMALTLVAMVVPGLIGWHGSSGVLTVNNRPLQGQAKAPQNGADPKADSNQQARQVRATATTGELAPSSILAPSSSRGSDSTNVTEPSWAGNNSHRAFVEQASRLGAPIKLITTNYNNPTVDTPDDIPSTPFLVQGNWDCFLGRYRWTAEQTRAFRGLHYFEELNVHDCPIAADILQSFRRMDTTVTKLTVQKQDLESLGHCLNARGLTLLAGATDRRPWPEFLGEQPQLTRLQLPVIGGDDTLRLISRNTALHSLLINRVDRTVSPSGIVHLQKLAHLKELKIEAHANIDPLIPALAELTQVKLLQLDAPAPTAAGLDLLAQNRPDLTVLHPTLPASQTAIAAVQAFREFGATVYCHPPWKAEEPQANFVVSELRCTQQVLAQMQAGSYPIPMLLGFHCTELQQADLNSLTSLFAGQPCLQRIVLNGTVAQVSRQTYENLAEGRALVSLVLNVQTTSELHAQDLLPLTQCPSLSWLRLPAGSLLDDSALELVGRCACLDRLEFHLKSAATARGVSSLKNLKNLTLLTLSGQSVDAAMLAELCELPALRLLDLQGVTHVSVPGLRNFQTALPKCSVILTNQVLWPLAAGPAIGSRP